MHSDTHAVVVSDRHPCRRPTLQSERERSSQIRNGGSAVSRAAASPRSLLGVGRKVVSEKFFG